MRVLPITLYVPIFIHRPRKPKEGTACQKIQLQTVMNCSVVAGKQIRALWQKEQPLLAPCAPAQSPPHLHLVFHLRQQKHLFVVHLSHPTTSEDVSSSECHRSGADSNMVYFCCKRVRR